MSAITRPPTRKPNSLRIATALAEIPNYGPTDWESWNRVGMAVWRATAGSSAGWEAFNAWSKRNQAYNADVTRMRWGHYTTSPPTSIGAGTIFYMADKCAGRPFVDPDDPGRTDEPTRDEPQTGTNSAAELILCPGTPLPSAREFLRLVHTEANMRTLHHQNATFYSWVETHYTEAAQEEVRHACTLLDKARRPTQKPGVTAPFPPPSPRSPMSWKRWPLRRSYPTPQSRRRGSTQRSIPRR